MSISVVIPTYNRGPKIAATLESVFAQTLAPLEIIVIDDGSTDGTADWIEAHYGDKIRVVRQANGGVARARNRGLNEARGEFIAYLDHDDRWLPQKLEQQLAALHNNSQAGVAYCLWQEIDDNEQQMGRAGVLQPDEWNRLPQGDVFALMMHRNIILSMSIPLVRTALLREVGGFDPALVPCDDWDVWIKLARRGEFVAVAQTLVVYVRHSNQQSSQETTMVEAARKLMLCHLKANPLFALRHPRTLWLALSVRAFARSRRPFYDQARAAIVKRQWRRATAVLCRAWLRHPLLLLTPQWVYVTIRLLRRNSSPF